MQEEPDKTHANFNEIRTDHPLDTLPPRGVIYTETEESRVEELQQIALSGIELVHSKIDSILGNGNRLTVEALAFPRFRFVDSDPEHPDWAGYFSSGTNEIVIITGAIDDNSQSLTKVFIHEYLHFLSHNGHDDQESLDTASPIARRNNVGFRRNTGLDIRKGREDNITSDYFLSFNEAVTEQLAIDILPNVGQTYEEYRGLLGQVIEDAMTIKLGSKNGNGEFVPWSKDQIKNLIYAYFFRGDLAGFTNLLKTVYAKYNISEQQFGLMTNRNDLPSVIEKALVEENPGGPPLPSQVRALVQERIDIKNPADYVTDVVVGGDKDPDGPEGKYGKEYDKFIEEHNITVLPEKNSVDGMEFESDNLGYIVYRGELARFTFETIKEELHNLIARLNNGEIDKEYVIGVMDEMLFKKYLISMLSDGFRDFYIYKHTKLGDC